MAAATRAGAGRVAIPAMDWVTGAGLRGMVEQVRGQSVRYRSSVIRARCWG